MGGVTVKLESEQIMALKPSSPALENHGDAVDGINIKFEENRSLPASGLNAANPNPSQLTIIYNGSICIYDGIPAEKVHEIMLMAAAAANSTETKKVGKQPPLLSPINTGPSSLHGTTDNIASPQAFSFTAKNSSICRLQEFPIARRHSLQRFLEKRRDRVGSKAPYPTSGTKKVPDDNIENDFGGDKSPDSVSLNRPEEEFQPTISAS